MSKAVKRLSKKEEKRRMAVYAKGLSDFLSAKELGINSGAYYRWRTERNLPAARPPKNVKRPTLCWNCKNTNRYKCTWFDPDNPQPVEGWVADAETITLMSGARKDGTRLTYVTETYRVRKCPNFDREE